MIEKVNLDAKFGTFAEHWQPKIVGEVNDCAVKMVKFLGSFVWHHHDTEDEMFLVVKGRMRIGLRDGDLVVNPGEFVIVPRGTEHRPSADVETHAVVFEPKSTLNTGNVRNERTVATPERI
jgi:mannose-6-phosphate isomerase-like protein (cupin superfamily)